MNSTETEENLQREMERLFGRIQKLLADQEYDECDALLATFEAKLFPPMFAVGVLRASFPVRKKLPSWEQVLGETREYLEAEDMNASHTLLLRGLFGHVI